VSHIISASNSGHSIESSLIRSYKALLGLPTNAPITEEMIFKHWELEKKLTNILKNTTAENRFETFECCYGQFYRELDWLNKYGGSGISNNVRECFFSAWAKVIGALPAKIYEVGSGKGELISFLAEKGYICKGSEITHERKVRHSHQANLSWGSTDGVHIADFEEKDSYNVVISNQVIEHLHPDDFQVHLQHIYQILKKDGRYLFMTPNRSLSPTDISILFGCKQAQGMHLKEYSYCEIRDHVLKAGYKKISAVWRLPARLKVPIGPFSSRWYLHYLCFLEKMIFRMPQHARRHLAKISMIVLFSPSMFFVARK